MAKLLVVEDDATLTGMINEWLTQERHTVELVEDGNEALSRMRFYQYDLIILDWGLPGMSGLDACKEFRQGGGNTPILMLTGKRSIDERVEGLDAGADDYLPKPFHMKELIARVRALLRRPEALQESRLAVGNLELDPISYCVKKDGKEIELLPREFALLEFFMRNPNRIFSTEALLERVWASDADATPEAFRSCLKRLRKRVDEDPENSIIRTIHGVGYKMVVS